MKSLNLFTVLVMLVAHSACSQMNNAANLSKAGETESDKKKIEKASVFANKFMNTLSKGQSYVFSDEATEAIKTLLTEKAQKDVFNDVTSQYGDYVGHDFQEAWIQNSAYFIARYKCDFIKGKDKVELRIVLDETNKVAGIWLKPWSDVLM